MDINIKIRDLIEGIGGNIRKLRASKGLSQDEFVKKNNLKSGANLSMIETGRNLPTLEAILNICLTNNITADNILFGDTAQGIKDNRDKLQKVKEIMQRFIEYQEQDFNEKMSVLTVEAQNIYKERDALRARIYSINKPKEKPPLLGDDNEALLDETYNNYQRKISRLKDLINQFSEDKKTMINFIDTYL